MSARLTGKVSVITGGGGGIGSAAGKIFCQEDSRVALIDSSEEAVQRAIAEIDRKSQVLKSRALSLTWALRKKLTGLSRRSSKNLDALMCW